MVGPTNPDGTFSDLGLFTVGNTNDLTYTEGSTALMGSVTLDLSIVAAYLPSVGTSGEIITGYNGSATNVEIGSWQVEATSSPEPSTWALLGFGAAFLALQRPLFARLRVRAQAQA